MQEQAQNKYRELSYEEKDEKWEYGRNRQINRAGIMKKLFFWEKN